MPNVCKEQDGGESACQGPRWSPGPARLPGPWSLATQPCPSAPPLQASSVTHEPSYGSPQQPRPSTPARVKPPRLPDGRETHQESQLWGVCALQKLRHPPPYFKDLPKPVTGRATFCPAPQPRPGSRPLPAPRGQAASEEPGSRWPPRRRRLPPRGVFLGGIHGPEFQCNSSHTRRATGRTTGVCVRRATPFLRGISFGPFQGRYI